MNDKKNIIIAGAGFGGITAALILEKKLRRFPEYRLILIDKNPYELYAPTLYEIATVPKEEAGAFALKSAAAIPIEDIVAGRNIVFRQEELIGLDKEKKIIFLKSGASLHYRFLVLALGSETNYFNIPGLEENALSLKTFTGAVRLRNRAEELVNPVRTGAPLPADGSITLPSAISAFTADRSRRRSNGVKRPARLRIVLGGGGPAGVELAAEFTNFICVLKERFGADKTCDVEIMIVETAPEILAGFESWLVKRARRRLESLGISIKNSCTITSVDRTAITTTAGTTPYDLLIWTGGVRAPKILEKFGLALNKKGQVFVNEALEAFPGIFAVGDNAGLLDRNKIPLPWNVLVAEGEGRLAAKNIIRSLRGQPFLAYAPSKKYPYILALGKKYAIADLIFIHLSGFWGWIAKLLVELFYLFSILPFLKAVRKWMSAVRVYLSND